MNNFERIKSKITLEDIATIRINKISNSSKIGGYYEGDFEGTVGGYDDALTLEIAWLNEEFEDKVLPCPFCGDEKVQLECSTDNYGEYYNIMCCYCFAKSGLESTTDKAVETWNQRAN
jgi:Lar family restriction alleviation protein